MGWEGVYRWFLGHYLWNFIPIQGGFLISLRLDLAYPSMFMDQPEFVDRDLKSYFLANLKKQMV